MQYVDTGATELYRNISLNLSKRIYGDQVFASTPADLGFICVYVVWCNVVLSDDSQNTTVPTMEQPAAFTCAELLPPVMPMIVLCNIRFVRENFLFTLI